MKIKKDDNVIVISGKDKGKTGKVTKTLPSEHKVIISGVNMKKKHQKSIKKGQKGQIIEINSPINVSNIMIIDPKTGKRSRIGLRKKDGKLERYSKKSKTVLN